jgi:Flp pilus assembly protein TadD
LYRAGRFEEAIAPMERALDSGAVDAHFLERAATVMRAAGRSNDGDALARRAHRINPHATGFHVHR